MRKGQRLYFILIFSILLAPSVTDLSLACAEDELYLSGILTSIDVKSGTVVVQVKSEGCLGPRRFKVRDVSGMDYLIGKKISFFINSMSCKDDTTHLMIFEGEKTGRGERR